MTQLLQPFVRLVTVWDRLTQTKSDTTVPEPELPNLQARLTRLTASIRLESVRTVFERVLGDLVFLLDYLSLIPEMPAAEDFEECISILQAVKVNASDLVSFIEQNAEQLSNINLQETLDGTAFVISHETRRILDTHFSETIRRDEVHACASILHARGVLRNCFQHCVINLVRMFDETLTASLLYEDWRTRRDQSVQLCYDLSALIDQIVHTANSRPYQVAHELQKFREGGMRLLMYRDWNEYQVLADEVIARITERKDVSDLLRQLLCYLQTLLRQVKTRSVLAEFV
ncbi:MAG: hypothetical protein ABR555_02020 [Pyrinomonadaceae bacterium]